jgi:hypothetical protein
VRTHEIYRDRVASELTVPLDDVLPGAAGIRTNPNTARFIRALADGVDREKAENRGYAIVPDAAGWWVQSYDRNALPIDWMFDVEIRGRPEIAARVIRSLDARRNTETVLLETVSAADLAKGNVPIGPGYSVAAYVRTHYQLQWQNDLIAAYR